MSDLIYPQSAFDAAERTANEDSPARTDVAQPALGAVSLGAWRVLRTVRRPADAFAGHSYGELTALCCRRSVMRADDFLDLRGLRGRLMAEAGGRGDAGAMLAVQAHRQASCTHPGSRKTRIDRSPTRIRPQQTVLSGPTAAIELRGHALRGRQHALTRACRVAAAFHSPLVAAAERAVPAPPWRSSRSCHRDRRLCEHYGRTVS